MRRELHMIGDNVVLTETPDGVSVRVIGADQKIRVSKDEWERLYAKRRKLRTRNLDRATVKQIVQERLK